MSVLIVIPCLNEEAHLPGLLAQMLDENPEARIVVADGGSTDASVRIVSDLAERHARLMLAHNPARIQSAGINAVARLFASERDGVPAPRWMVRVDAHCDYPHGYVAGLVRSAEAHGATSVVVPMFTRGVSCFQRGVAAAQNSRLGNGGAPHRNIGKGAFVDHGHHALFNLALFLDVGGYDENFSHNEDAELDHRLIAAGGRIWLEPQQMVIYYPRGSPQPLMRQYLSYGQGRAKNLRRHHMPIKLRQIAPLAITPMVLMAMVGAVLMPFVPAAGWLVLPAMLWAAICLTYGSVLALRQRNGCVLCAGIAAMLIHLAWSAGFLTERWRSNRA